MEPPFPCRAVISYGKIRPYNQFSNQPSLNSSPRKYFCRLCCRSLAYPASTVELTGVSWCLLMDVVAQHALQYLSLFSRANTYQLRFVIPVTPCYRTHITARSVRALIYHRSLSLLDRVQVAATNFPAENSLLMRRQTWWWQPIKRSKMLVAEEPTLFFLDFIQIVKS